MVEKLPGPFQENMKRERLFHGLHQNLRDSIQFCYKQKEVDYDGLLSEILDAEKEKQPEQKMALTTVRVKLGMVEVGESSGIQDLKKKIEDLTTVVKSGMFHGAKPKQGNGYQKGNRNGYKDRNKTGGQTGKTGSPYKGKGPATTSAGPFKPGQHPFQCFQCRGWGHT